MKKILFIIVSTLSLSLSVQSSKSIEPIETETKNNCLIECEKEFKACKEKKENQNSFSKFQCINLKEECQSACENNS